MINLKKLNKTVQVQNIPENLPTGLYLDENEDEEVKLEPEETIAERAQLNPQKRKKEGTGLTIIISNKLLTRLPIMFCNDTLSSEYTFVFTGFESDVNSNWMSNHSDILNGIPKEQLLSQNMKLLFSSEITERALGLLWDVKKNGKLIFQHSSKSLPNTKRGILSLVASISDPRRNL